MIGASVELGQLHCASIKHELSLVSAAAGLLICPASHWPQPAHFL